MLFPAQRAHGSNPPNPLGLRNTSPCTPPQRPPSSREGDRPQAVEGVPLPRPVKRCSSRYLHLTGFTRRSSPPALPPITYRGFAFAPITLRPSQRNLTVPPSPRTSPQRPPSLREGDRPQAVEGVYAHRAPYHPSRALLKPLIHPRVQGRNPARFNGGYGVPRGFKGEKFEISP